MMKRSFPALLFPVYLLLILVFPVASNPPRAQSSVMVFHESGHGSGVHIGQGIILTAAHVVPRDNHVSVMTTTGQEMRADVIFIDREYDVAALRVAGHSGMMSSRISCRVPDIGEHIVTTGNPANLKFVTIWGRVSGPLQSIKLIKEVIVTDMTTIPGMSGGGVLDRWGRVVGTVSAVMTAPMFGVPLAIGYVVPAATSCELLKRSGVLKG